MIVQLRESITPDIRDALLKGTHAIYVYGRVVYEDTFGKMHFTSYCFFQNKEVFLTKRWNLYEDRNDAN